MLSQTPCMQRAGVQYVLDTVVAALAANPDRKFTFAEMVRPLFALSSPSTNHNFSGELRISSGHTSEPVPRPEC